MPQIENITVTITSCGRIDLLKRTIASFLETNTYPIYEYIVINDDPPSKDLVDEVFANLDNCNCNCRIKIIHNTENIGLKRSLDVIFNMVTTEYFFHLEDDWFFEHKNSYIEDSLTILENSPDIHQVWVRHAHDTPHPVIGVTLTCNGVEHCELHNDFNGVWNGYSWNPGLRRKSDYIRMFPNGVAEFKSEMECAVHSRKFNYRVVQLKNTACYHIGYNRSTCPDG
jgi:GT2 family glycosyltransferase